MDKQTLIFHTTPSPALFPNPIIISVFDKASTPASIIIPTIPNVPSFTVSNINNETNISDDVAKDIARVQTESLLVASSILDSLTKRLALMSESAFKASTMAHAFQEAIEVPLTKVPLPNYDLTDLCQQLNKALHDLDHSRMLCILSYSALKKTGMDAKALILEKRAEDKKRQEKRKYHEDKKSQKKSQKKLKL
jgi:hypothetical protein